MKSIFNNILYITGLSLMIYACSEDSISQGDFGSETGEGGSMARFTIAKDHLYAVDRYTLKSFSIQDESNPVYVDSLDIGWDIETIFPFGDYLFIGSQSGMYIYSIATPDKPKEESVTLHQFSCDPVVSDGKYAYVTLNTVAVGCGNTENLLEIYDIADITKPKTIKRYTMEGPAGLAVEGDFLYVCDNGLKIFNKTDVANLKQVQHISDIDAYDVIVDDGLIMLTGDNGFFQYYFDGTEAVFLSKIEKGNG